MAKIATALFIVIVMFMPVISPVYSGLDEDVLTKEYLINNEWGPNVGELGLFFKFSGDTFKTNANFEGGAYYSGIYEIVDKKLFLKIIRG